MAKYRVYLKNGMGVFDLEATNIESNDCDYNCFDNNDHVALFDKASVLAIVNTDKAERAFASGGVVSGDTINAPYIINRNAKEGDTHGISDERQIGK